MNIIKASSVNKNTGIPELPLGIINTTKDNKFQMVPLINARLEDQINIYKDRARRLRSDIPKNSDPNIIDAHCKGRLEQLEDVIADLEYLLKTYSIM